MDTSDESRKKTPTLFPNLSPSVVLSKDPGRLALAQIVVTRQPLKGQAFKVNAEHPAVAVYPLNNPQRGNFTFLSIAIEQQHFCVFVDLGFHLRRSCFTLAGATLICQNSRVALDLRNRPYPPISN